MYTVFAGVTTLYVVPFVGSAMSVLPYHESPAPPAVERGNGRVSTFWPVRWRRTPGEETSINAGGPDHRLDYRITRTGSLPVEKRTPVIMPDHVLPDAALGRTIPAQER